MSLDVHRHKRIQDQRAVAVKVAVRRVNVAGALPSLDLYLERDGEPEEQVKALVQIVMYYIEIAVSHVRVAMADSEEEGAY